MHGDDILIHMTCTHFFYTHMLYCALCIYGSQTLDENFLKECEISDFMDFAKTCDEDHHVWFTLVKREQTTPEALTKIARAFQLPTTTKVFSFCGMMLG